MTDRDGYSFFMFMNYWAAISRGERPQWHPNHNRGELVDIAKRKLSEDQLGIVDKNLFESKTGFSYGDVRHPISSRDTKWVPRPFSFAEIEPWRAQPGLSLNDILMATLWQQVGKEWNSTEDIVELSWPIDCRRYIPGFGTTYFGNFIRACMVKLPQKELVSRSTLEIAKIIRSATAAVDRPSFEGALAAMLKLWQEQGLAGIQRVQITNPNVGFLVTNMSRLDVKSIDFGSGAPTFVATPTPAKRVATVLAHPLGLMVQVSQPQ